MAKKELTPRQKQIYDYILRYTQRNLYPPSVTEICAATKTTSSSDVWRFLRILEDKGYIRLGRHAATRAITLTGYKLVRTE